MANNSRVILGISPGSRIIGLAVIISGELVEWKVKSFKEKWCCDKRAAILSVIEKLFDHYDVSVISLKKMDPLKSSFQTDALVLSIEQLGERKKVEVLRYSLSDLDYDSRPNKRDGKTKLPEQVVEKHPVLKKEYFKEMNNRREYYIKMFEAVAMAERCREW
jgi:hypothetical protein